MNSIFHGRAIRDLSPLDHISRVADKWFNLADSEILEIVKIQRQQKDLGVTQHEIEQRLRVSKGFKTASADVRGIR
jgi:hypothetical protein